MFVLPFLHPSDDVGVQSAALVPVHLLYFAALAVMLLVLVGILTRQLQRVGRLGVAGFLQRFAMVLNHIAWLGACSFMGNLCER